MAVYKDKSRGTWYASFLYEDWGDYCLGEMEQPFVRWNNIRNQNEQYESLFIRGCYGMDV